MVITTIAIRYIYIYIYCSILACPRMEESQLRGRLVAACAARLAVSQQGHRVKLRMMKDVVYLEDTVRDMMDDDDG